MVSIVKQRLGSGSAVLLESAVGLKHRGIASPYVPYVDFTWPVRAQIRVLYPLPFDPRTGDAVIATFAHQPVALRVADSSTGTASRCGAAGRGSRRPPLGDKCSAMDAYAHRRLEPGKYSSRPLINLHKKRSCVAYRNDVCAEWR
jgi:hypothetical protein